jgi:hypothetical protein
MSEHEEFAKERFKGDKEKFNYKDLLKILAHEPRSQLVEWIN